MKKQKGIIEPQNIIHSKESTVQKLIALASHEAELDTIRGSNYYKRLYRKGVELHNFERVVELWSSIVQVDVMSTKKCHKVKHLQTVISEQKKSIADLSSAQKTFQAAVSPLQIEIDGYAGT